MTDVQMKALRDEIKEEFKALNARLDRDLGDIQQALHGIMYRTMLTSEIEEVRSRMKNPKFRDMPFP